MKNCRGGTIPGNCFVGGAGELGDWGRWLIVGYSVRHEAKFGTYLNWPHSL